MLFFDTSFALFRDEEEASVLPWPRPPQAATGIGWKYGRYLRLLWKRKWTLPKRLDYFYFPFQLASSWMRKWSEFEPCNKWVHQDHVLVKGASWVLELSFDDQHLGWTVWIVDIMAGVQGMFCPGMPRCFPTTDIERPHLSNPNMYASHQSY